MRLRGKFESGAGRSQRAEPKRPRPERAADAKAPSPAARNLALAHHLERLVQRGVVADYTQAARVLGVSQPRTTHLMGLLLLSPAIQEAILLGELAPREKELRGLARVADWGEQEGRVWASRHRGSGRPQV